MKKFVLIILVSISSMAYSQTQTKKYNSFNKHYEYFDSKGNMIGYEFYNDFTKQWEYYEEKPREPYKYAEPAKLDTSWLQMLLLYDNKNKLASNNGKHTSTQKIQKDEDYLNVFKIDEEARNFYNSKDYSSAGDKYAELFYNLEKTKNINVYRFIFAYYSAICYSLSGRYKDAIEMYNLLIKNELLIDKKTKINWEDVYETNIKLLMLSNSYDDANKLLEKSSHKFPKNLKFLELYASYYYKLGNAKDYLTSLENIVKVDHNNITSLYNIGVIKSKDPNTQSEAIETFKKVIKIDPKYINAYKNLIFLTIGNDDQAIQEIDKSRNEGDSIKFQLLIKQRKQRFINALLFAENLYRLSPNDTESTNVLKGLYRATGMKVKFKELEN